MSKPCWELLREFFKTNFDNDYNIWLAPITCLNEQDKEIVLSVPNAYYKNIFVERYKQKSEDFLLRKFNKEIHISLNYNSDDKKKVDDKDELEYEITDKETKYDANRSITDYEQRSNIGDTPLRINKSLVPTLNSDFTLDNYIVGPNNEIACAAAKGIIRTPGKKYNPLFIYGGVGLGKTHLQQGIAHSIHQKHLGSYVIYVTCEQFTNEYIRSIQEKKTHAFRLKYRNADVLLIDDIQFLETKTGVQEELFHTYNQLRESGKQMVFTSDRSPDELKSIQDRLISRFSSGLTVEIELPDIETKIAIINHKTKLHNIEINNELIDFMVSNKNISIRSLEAGITKLKLLTEMDIPLTDVQFVIPHLQGILAINRLPKKKNVLIKDIQLIVAKYFDLDVQNLLSKVRKGNIVLARQLAMYLARQLTSCSVREIGLQFGGKNHSSVTFACDKIYNKLQSSLELKNDYDILCEKLAS